MRVPLLNFEGDPGVPPLNFEGGSGVPLLNFEGGPLLHHAAKPVRRDKLFLTTKSPEVPSTHLIDLGKTRAKSTVKHQHCRNVYI